MKRFTLFIMLVLTVSFAGAQTLTLKKGHVWFKHYGATYFKGDSVYVSSQGTDMDIWVKCDTTAGTTVAYFCQNDDSTRAIPILPPVLGNYGEFLPFKVFGLKHFRVKGAMPITVIVPPQIPK